MAVVQSARAWRAEQRAQFVEGHDSIQSTRASSRKERIRQEMKASFYCFALLSGGLMDASKSHGARQRSTNEQVGRTMRVAIVIGASSGIGQSTAIQLAKRGTGVILTYSGNQAGAQDTVAAIEKEGGTAVALRLDVGRSGTFPAFREQVVAALRDTWQRDTFDYLVNNAGFGAAAMFEDTTEELFDKFMRVLLKGPYFLTQALLPLLADGGAIVNVTSNSALPTVRSWRPATPRTPR